MAIPQKKQNTPTRAVRTFVIGKGSFLPPVSTQAASTNQTSAQTTPHPNTFTGTDSGSATVSVPKLAAGGTATLSVTIPFANLPAAASGPSSGTATRLKTQTTDTIVFNVNAQVSASPIGIALQAISTVPTAISSGIRFTGPRLSPGQTYTSFVAIVGVTVYAAAAFSGGLLTVSANGSLVVQQG